MTSSSSEYGVYYQTSDYAGVWRRFAIEVVDLLVVIVLSLTVSFALYLLIPDSVYLGIGMFGACLAVWFGYWVLLKRSSIRTIGYILASTRIVNLQGMTPSIASLVIRMIFGIFGPLNILFDLFWIPSEPSKQALRDKFAHTYVVRRNASPAGKGRICYVPYTLLGSSYIFKEVKPSQAASTSLSPSLSSSLSS